MENNQSNITEEAKSNENLETPNEQIQQNEKTFSQEEVSQMIKDRLARERRKSDEVWDINNIIMLSSKFTVVTELRRRLNQAFLSSSHPCRVETTNLKEFCPTPIQEEKLAKMNKDQKVNMR